MSKQTNVLREAEKIVRRARMDEHGEPVPNIRDAAAVAAVLLRRRGIETFEAEDLVLVLLALKMVRMVPSFHHDSHVDLAGYLLVLEDLLRSGTE